MQMTVLSPGQLTTVQDLGRPGWRRHGVTAGGAMDAFALRAANLLVGNPATAAGLEFTLTGPRLSFSTDALVAVCGGEFGSVSSWRPVVVRAGEELSLEKNRTGCRGFLAVSGGLDVPAVLGGLGTDLRGGFGGHEGRALRAGDELRVGPGVFDRPGTRAGIALNHFISPGMRPEYSRSPTVRVVRGADAGDFSTGFFAAAFTVSARSDRMGLRLEGRRLERRAGAAELISSPVAPGTIQVPPDGRPIILMADAQTFGGYPKIAHVISADLPLLAQLRSGDTVGFRAVTPDEAHRVRFDRDRDFAILRHGLAGRIR